MNAPKDQFNSDTSIPDEEYQKLKAKWAAIYAERAAHKNANINPEDNTDSEDNAEASASESGAIEAESVATESGNDGTKEQIEGQIQDTRSESEKNNGGGGGGGGGGESDAVNGIFIPFSDEKNMLQFAQALTEVTDAKMFIIQTTFNRGETS